MFVVVQVVCRLVGCRMLANWGLGLPVQPQKESPLSTFPLGLGRGDPDPNSGLTLLLLVGTVRPGKASWHVGDRALLVREPWKAPVFTPLLCHVSTYFARAPRRPLARDWMAYPFGPQLSCLRAQVPRQLQPASPRITSLAVGCGDHPPPQPSTVHRRPLHWHFWAAVLLESV